MPDVDDYNKRLDAAQQAYNVSVGSVQALEQQRISEVSRLLEAHGVTEFESLEERKTQLEHEAQEAKKKLDAAFEEAGI